MTLERAAEMVGRLRSTGDIQNKVAAIDLAEHFVHFFRLDPERAATFLGMCGWE